MPPQLAAALRHDGFDALSCPEAGLSNRGISDAEQLAFAAREGRAILTFDVRDYRRLDAEWKSAGRAHAGIIVSPEISDFGTLLRRVEQHLSTVLPSLQHDTVLWL